MAATGIISGIAGNKLFYVDTVMTDKSANNCALECVANNEVGELRNIGDVVDNYDTVDVPAYGRRFVKKVPTTINADDFELEVTYLNEDSIHQAIKNGDAGVERSFIIQTTDPSNGVSYTVVDGYFGSRARTFAFDDVQQMRISIVRTSEWVDVDGV